VPAHSIVTTQQGSYVYVVKANNMVEQRTIVPNRTIDNDTVVDKGLRPGEVIVLDGQVNLVPGAKIEAKNGSPEPMAEPAGRPSEAGGPAAKKGAAADPPQGDPNHPRPQ
jgi:membrane fusion protein, multidrug efflux system